PVRHDRRARSSFERCGRLHRRTRARRGRRQRTAGGVSARGACTLRQGRRAVDCRRSANGPRTLRLSFRLLPRRRRSRRHDAGQRPLRRRHAGGGLHSAAYGLECRIRQASGHPHVDVRRKRAGLRGCARSHERARRRQPCGTGARTRRSTPQRRAETGARVSCGREGSTRSGPARRRRADERRLRRMDHSRDGQARRDGRVDAEHAAGHPARAALDRYRRRGAARAGSAASRPRHGAREARRTVAAMPYVQTSITVAAPARIVYELAKDQEHFPQFMPDVESVTILERRPGGVLSRWKTLVEEAPIEWTEEDRFDDDALRIDYRLLEGDLDTFEGAWTFGERDGATHVVLGVEYDFGVPTLAELIGPTLERKVRENSEMMLAALKREAESKNAEISASMGAARSA